MTGHAWWVTAALLATISAVAGAQRDSTGFPHARHARLFPLCSGCHAGITTGNAARTLPSPTLCGTCHDGTIQRQVRWAPHPPRGAGLLVFSHPEHLAKAKDVSCATCHALGDTTQWMNVGHATPERCFSCHAHQATSHYAADNNCGICHRPLTQAVALNVARISALPKPSSHDDSNFLTTHGALARANVASCAICHARESCERCHVDASRQPLIRALGSDARVAQVARDHPPVYPTPEDHRGKQFALNHGVIAASQTARCAICHARPSCEACHTGTGGRDVIQRLPGHNLTAPGVQLVPLAPPGFLARLASMLSGLVPSARQAPRSVGVHPAGFAYSHAGMASSGELQCAGCHTQRFCTECHAGEFVTRRYHPQNFVSLHAPQAYARETECTSCHSTEAFCRACHRQMGLAAKTNARSTVFHNAQPLWLLQHGRAARQDLNACATCHQQTYCMQCHSDLGARINPHGPGFDAAKMSSKNPQLCLMCHFTNPLKR